MPELIAVSAAPPPPSAPSSASSSTPPAGDASGDVFGKLLRGLTSDTPSGKGKRDGDDPLAGALQALAAGAMPAVSLYSQQGTDATDATANGSASRSAPRGSAGASIAAGSTAPAPATPASVAATPQAPSTAALAQATPAPPPSGDSATTPLGPRLSASAAPPAPPTPPDSTLGASGVTSAANASRTQDVAAPSADAAVQVGPEAMADAVATRDPQTNARSNTATTLLPPDVTLLQIATSGAGAGDQPTTIQQSPAPPPASLLPVPPLPPLLSGRSIFVRRADTPNATFSVNLAAIGTPSQPAQTTSAATAQTWSSPAAALPKNAATTSQTATPTQAAAAPAIPTIAVAAPNAGQQASTDTGSTGDDAGAQSTPSAHAAGTAAASFGVDSTAALDTSSLAASLALTIRSGVTEARLQLRPAGLGEVHVQITTSREGVVLRLAAESTAVGDLLREHVGELRDALAAHGVTVTDLHVLPNQPAQPIASSGGPAWQDGGRRASRNPQDGSSADAPPQDDTDTDGQGG
jgi:flagellar hook-length control protein FliK